MLIAKTEAGQHVMKDRSVALTPRQRSAFILIDGKKTLEQVLESTAATGVTRADIDRLLELGLIARADGRPRATEAAAAAATAAPAVPVAADAERKTPQERYAEAYPIAIRLTSALGLRGFRLNLAVEGAGSYEELLQVAPRIREAVGPERYQPLQQVLGGR
jgi:hypothetical protein